VVPAGCALELWWIPLGAGGHFVRANGRIFEALSALRESRPRRRLYHSALLLRIEGRTLGIEQTPAWGRHADRKVVARGPVGTPLAGRVRLLRYEIHIAPGGGIPDLDAAVDSPRLLSEETGCAHAVLDGVHRVPALTWGRDERGYGEMWNSNSVIAWTLATSGIDAAAIDPPPGGRAPGWRAGWTLARDEGPFGHPQPR